MFIMITETALVLFFLNTAPAVFSSPLLVLMYGVQIVQTLRKKDVTGISPWFFVLLSIVLGFAVIAQVLAFLLYGTSGLLIKELTNFIPALIMTVLVFYYRKYPGGKKAYKEMQQEE